MNYFRWCFTVVANSPFSTLSNGKGKSPGSTSLQNCLHFVKPDISNYEFCNNSKTGYESSNAHILLIFCKARERDHLNERKSINRHFWT